MIELVLVFCERILFGPFDIPREKGAAAGGSMLRVEVYWAESVRSEGELRRQRTVLIEHVKHASTRE